MLGKQVSFNTARYGLQPIAVDTWGPLVFLDLDGKTIKGENNPRSLAEDVKDLDAILEPTGWNNLKFFHREVYTMNCNWKVFVDNSLDGCYHCLYAHEQLAAELDLNEFEVKLFDRSSVQMTKTHGKDKRLGDTVAYCYLYPNLFVNRYGNMMDINIVEPLGVNKCRVIFDFFFAYDNMEDWQSQKRMRQDMASSHLIQRQDVDICESVQRGMESVSFRHGRYSSALEAACYDFHVLHWHELRGVTR